MSDIVVKAASWLGPDGFGNELSGLKEWPAPLAEALRRGEIEALRWSSLFESDGQRFARMDWLSRLGLIAVELLNARFEAWSDEDRNQTAVVLETTAGCITSDTEFLELTRPSVFAYTLPSTVIGEICIRHCFKGPILCLMSSDKSTRAAIDEAELLLRTGNAKACLCVGCEAVSSAAAALLPSELVLKNSWEAFALLLGKELGDSRERSLGEGTLSDICRDACGAVVRC